MTQFRAGRLANEIQKEVADIIRNEVKDPRMGFVSIVLVDVPKDLTSAKIYISCLDDNQAETLKSLESAKGFIRRELGKRLRSRVVPELFFHIDDSIAYGIKMSGIIAKQIEADEEAAALRPPGEEEQE